MKFCWSTLHVKNLEESLKFYQEVVGLPLANRFKAGPTIEIAFLGDGDTKVELLCDGSGKVSDVGKDISWGFEVDSLDDAYDAVKKKGISIYREPFQPNPHTRFFFIRDPNGFLIQIAQNM